MSSRVSRLERNAAENKKNPYRRMYSITLHCPRGTFFNILKDAEWGFIFDGIMNPPLHNIFQEKEIYLEYTHTADEVLSMTPDQRALIIAQEAFDSLESFYQYCLDNNIDIISNYTVTKDN